MKDERFFEMASAELEAGKIRPGLRAKAFSDANGEDNLAHALYLKYRVAQLAQEEWETRKAEAKKRSRDLELAVKKAQVEPERLPLVHWILLGLMGLMFGLIIWKLL